MNNKSKTKTQSELAIQALMISLKSIATLILSAIAYFADFNIVALIITIFAFLYLTYIAIEQKAYTTVIKYFRRAIKFKKIHNYFEEIQTNRNELPIRQFFDKNTPKKRRHHHHKAQKSQLFSQIQEDILNLPVYSSIGFHSEEYVHNREGHKKSREAGIQLKQYEKYYVAVREQYKKSFEEMCGRDSRRQQFEATVAKIRHYYVNKVSQLLQMNRVNLRKMKQELQKNYLVKIIQKDDEEKSLELTNATIDEAIQRMIEYPQKKCFPWTQKPDRQEFERKAHRQNLQKITRDRKQIDKFLAPYYPLNQKLRDQAVKILQKQLSHPSLIGRQLIYTVVEIFNDKLRMTKNSEQFYVIRKDFTTRPCLQILQTIIHDHLHIDLLLKRPDKEKKIICNPGENNLWTLIAFAIQIIRYKL